jgi:hypothetical protein
MAEAQVPTLFEWMEGSQKIERLFDFGQRSWPTWSGGVASP